MFAGLLVVWLIVNLLGAACPILWLRLILNPDMISNLNITLVRLKIIQSILICINITPAYIIIGIISRIRHTFHTFILVIRVCLTFLLKLRLGPRSNMSYRCVVGSFWFLILKIHFNLRYVWWRGIHHIYSLVWYLLWILHFKISIY